MAWVSDGHLYRFNVKCGLRVHSVYLTGEQAVRVAEQVESRKENRKKISARLAYLRAEARGLDTQTRQLDHVSKALVTATMIQGGLHEHRGCWRRPRRAELR